MSSRSPTVMANALSYRLLPTPLHATRAPVSALWAAALACAALALEHPLTLASILATALLAGVAAGVGAQLVRALRAAAIVGLPIVLINVLVSREGLTVFARLGDLGPFGQGDLTLEALAYGGVIALKVTILILLSALASAAVDPDELLRGLRRLSFRSALTASLAVRMVPLLAADAHRLAEAQRTRPQPTGGLRSRALLLGATVGSSLDRAVDVAATLELRGFESARRAPRRPRPWSRHDLAFLCSALAMLLLTIAARVGATASFEAYPRPHAPVTVQTLVLCVAIPVSALAPFCDRRGVFR
jgi:energy-coupling factor transport system permease protein